MIAIGTAAGLIAGYAIPQFTISNLNSKLEELRDKSTRIEILYASANATLTSTAQQLKAKENELASALATLRTAQSETEAVKQKLEMVRRALAKIDADRALLVDLRREVPDRREDARSFWQDVRGRAVVSDSTLGAAVDRILDGLDTYFDWIDVQPGVGTTPEEYGRWLFKAAAAGAFDYLEAIDDFRSDALLVAIIHIEQAAGLFA